MKTRYLFITFFAIAAFAGLAHSQKVVVTGNKVTYIRPKPLADFKKTFTINHPVVTAATQSLSVKIESAISFQKVIPLDIAEEVNEIQWLENADYEVLYNDNGALCIALSIEGSGAYPSGSTKTVVVDTLKGDRVKPADTFKNLSGIVALVKKAQKIEIAKAIKAIRKDPDFREPDPKTLFISANFKTEDLDWFSISHKGVTFNYDYGFPHVMQALQPDGKFFFSWKQLKPYIKAGSLLSRVAR
ncbi:MAG: hypothetical protein IPK98_03765 [Chloracidobacterium sp.]|nr:hypothetical protein [Chloracidobacterium sp.]